MLYHMLDSQFLYTGCNCVVKRTLLPRGGAREFLRVAPNQKESDLSHIGNLNYIHFGQFDENKNREGGKVSRQRWWVGGGCHLRKLKVAILKNVLIVWSENLLCILKLSFPSLISQKPGEILIFGTFLANFSILAYISLKISSLCSVMIMTSLWRHTWDFGMYRNRRPQVRLPQMVALQSLSKTKKITGNSGTFGTLWHFGSLNWEPLPQAILWYQLHVSGG